MEKQRIIDTLVAKLTDDLKALHHAAQAAHEAATHEESQQEDSHDTRSIEASYLAGAQAGRAADLARLIHLFRNFPFREFAPAEPASPGALLELESAGTRSHYLVVPQGGGVMIQVEGRTIQIITSVSPIGEAVLGKKAGQIADVETRTGIREYKIVSVT